MQTIDFRRIFVITALGSFLKFGLLYLMMTWLLLALWHPNRAFF